MPATDTPTANDLAAHYNPRGGTIIGCTDCNAVIKPGDTEPKDEHGDVAAIAVNYTGPEHQRDAYFYCADCIDTAVAFAESRDGFAVVTGPLVTQFNTELVGIWGGKAERIYPDPEANES